MNFKSAREATTYVQYIKKHWKSSKYQRGIPYRRDIYKPLNRTSSRIAIVAAASGLAQEKSQNVALESKITERKFFFNDQSKHFIK